ncbi:MAG: VIT domain-containing protein [Candidatus Poribacteria bacterium]|nr:VIT domain-containing protein [Candidatus Poribacteria bacterium]
MKRLTIHTTLLILIFSCFVHLAHAQGIIIPRPPRHPHFAPLAIECHHVTISIDNQLATTKIDQIFANKNRFQLEGTYLFPLPDDAAVSDFAMYIDGERVKGELLSKDKARQIYEGIVRRAQDPALLEYIGRRAFQARVFPIPANGEKRIQLEYSQVIHVNAGLAKYTYPLRTEKFTDQPVESLALSMTLESKHDIKTIYSPSHNVEIVRKSDRRAKISYEDTNVKPKRDFVCYYSLSDKDFGIDVIAHRADEDEDGYFMLLVSPKYETKQSEIIDKDLVFVLDRSGSMRGEKLKQAKDALRFCVRNLNDGDRFNLILFSTEIEPFSEELVSVDGVREKALAFIDEIESLGGTNINEALLTALKEKPDPKRPRIIIFLTDGLPTVGETDVGQIIKNVAAANDGNARLFVFGVGYDVNTQLLDKLAEENRGTRQYVEPKEDLEVAVSSFFTKVSEPVLVNLELDTGKIKTKDRYPKKLPDLFRGAQLTVLGRYKEHGDTKIKLRGEVAGKQQEFSHKVSFPKRERDHEFLPHLWAQRKVAYLVDTVRLNGEDKELIDEIVRLSKKYGIMTPYTSFLVQEDDRPVAAAPMSSQPATHLIRGRAMRIDSSVLRVEEELARQSYSMGRSSGADAVRKSRRLQEMKLGEQEESVSESVKRVSDKTFYLRDSVWVDSDYKKEGKTQKIEYGSEAYFDLIAKHPELNKYLAIGKRVIVCYKGKCYEITSKNQD